jgi:hypothetical protein
MSSHAHSLTTTWDKEAHLQPVIDRIVDFHLGISKGDLNEESPKGECAKAHEIYTYMEFSAKVNVWDAKNAHVPTASTIHEELRAIDPLF